MSELPPPSRPRRPPTVVLAAAEGSLEGVDERLRRAGVRVVRIGTVRIRPVPQGTWLPNLVRRSVPDTVVVTSRAAVDAGVRPWLRAAGDVAMRAEFWAVGPRTASALRRAGVTRVRSPVVGGAAGLVRSFTARRSRAVLYLRSDRAGAFLPRRLRARGHRVYDRVVYRLAAAARMTAREQRLVAAADLWVVTSPSGVDALRRDLGRTAFRRAAERIPLVVLGTRSRAAALRVGFATVSVVPPTTAQRFTGRLLRELRHARS